jgi:hypothetical protein
VPVILVCQVCDKQFEVRPSAVKNGRKYCSMPCRNQGNWPAVVTTCINCGTEYRTPPHDADKAKYCSRKCLGEYRRTSGELAGKNSHAWKGGGIETSCDYCGAAIRKIRADYNEDAHHFCDRTCFGKYRRGENHPLWKGGEARSRHGGGAYKAWREAVYLRDDWTCQECGVRSCKGNRVKLHAHHIFPFADYSEHRFNIWNGLTLCVDCHTNHHPKMKIKQEVSIDD